MESLFKIVSDKDAPNFKHYSLLRRPDLEISFYPDMPSRATLTFKGRRQTISLDVKDADDVMECLRLYIKKQNKQKY